MAYTVRFSKMIRMPGQWVHLVRRVELSFPPFPGLTIDMGGWKAIIESVVWDFKNQEFHVKIQTLNFYDLQDAEKHLQDLLASGWERQ